jgi:hypothetical protein
MAALHKSHLEVVTHILRYVQKIADYGLFYRSQGNNQVQGFTDADWVACQDTRRSTGGYLFKMVGASITWQSKRQPIVSHSSTESEYIALSTTTHEAVWLTRFLGNLSSSTTLPLQPTNRQVPSTLQPAISILVHCDNQYTLNLARNPIFHTKTKHIEVHHHHCA